jgi:hypothetical protein
MTLYEIMFKATHDCPFCNISKKYPSMKMFIWCNREHEVIEVDVESDSEYEEVLTELSRIGRKVEESFSQHKIHFITTGCSCHIETSIGRNIDDCDLLHISPVFYENGWEHYRVVALRHEDAEKLFNRLSEMGVGIEVIRKTPFDGFIASSLTLNADSLFSKLTDKQINALIKSYANGYYRIPRALDVKDIAAHEKVPRTTFQDHLRRAENRLVEGLLPYLELYKKASPEKRRKLHFFD